MTKASNVDEIPSAIHDTLVDEYGDSQKERVRGYFMSQSFRELMAFLDPEDIQELHASSQVTEESAAVGVPKPIRDYAEGSSYTRRKLKLVYNRKKHPTLDPNAVIDWLNDNPEIYDLPVSRLVLQVRNDALYDHMLELLEQAIGFPDPGEFEQPFFAVMESSKAEMPKVRRNVREYHEDFYFRNPSNQGESRSGLNWNVMSMDLKALWSYRAWSNSKNQPFSGYTMHDIEDLAVNHVGSSTPEYGAINSKLVVNKWRQEFSRGTTDLKKWEWEDDQQGWVRVE